MSALPGLAVAVPHEEQQASADNPKWEMKTLKPWHRQMCSLLAQGIDRGTIAHILDCTPEYISMLCRQQKIIDHVKEMSVFANVQLEAAFTKSVTAISEVLENGNAKEKMQAARLQMEATKRIGSKMQDEEKLIDTNARLARLAERLLILQGHVPTTNIIDGEVITHEAGYEGAAGEDGTEAEDGRFPSIGSNQPAQDAGDGDEDSRGE